MKKIIFLTTLVIIITLAGCSKEKNENQDISSQEQISSSMPGDNDGQEIDVALEKLMTKITGNLGEMPMTENIPLDKESFKSFTFAEYIEGAVGVASEPMMSSIAHSVVLVKLPKGRDSVAFANEMKTNADPRKWLCVEAEKVSVASKGQLAILVMSSETVTDKIIDNFKNL